jgi:hypothetical protein
MNYNHTQHSKILYYTNVKTHLKHLPRQQENRTTIKKNLNTTNFTFHEARSTELTDPFSKTYNLFIEKHC